MENQLIKKDGYNEVEEFVWKVSSLVKDLPIKQDYTFMHRNNSDNYYNDVIEDVILLLESIYEFMPKFGLTDFIKYSVDKHRTVVGDMAKVLMNFMFDDFYKSEIKLAEDRFIVRDLLLIFDEKSPIGIFCRKMQNRYSALDIMTADNQDQIEQILRLPSIQGGLYVFGIKRLVTFYKKEIDRMNDSNLIKSFIDKKTAIEIHLNLSKYGKEFLEYANNILKRLEVEEFEKTADTRYRDTSNPEELSEIAQTISQNYEPGNTPFDQIRLMASCKNKIDDLIYQGLCSNMTDEQFANSYQHCPFDLKPEFLKKWLDVTNDDSMNNIIIYKELSEKFTSEKDSISKARGKIIKLFASKTKLSDVCKLVNDLCSREGKYSIKNPLSNDVVMSVTEHINTASIDELIDSKLLIIVFKSRTMNEAILDRFFHLNPSFSQTFKFRAKTKNNIGYHGLILFYSHFSCYILNYYNQLSEIPMNIVDMIYNSDANYKLNEFNKSADRTIFKNAYETLYCS